MANPARWILAAMGCGIAAGTALHALAPAPVLHAITDAAGTAAELFLRLVRSIVAPLVLATLAGGVAGMRGQAGTGRVALLAMGWFALARRSWRGGGGGGRRRGCIRERGCRCRCREGRARPGGGSTRTASWSGWCRSA